MKRGSIVRILSHITRFGGMRGIIVHLSRDGRVAVQIWSQTLWFQESELKLET